MGKFSDQVGKFVDKSERLYRATARTAVQDTVSMAQRVRKKGGRMRVKTGFLRASIQGNINGMPSGPTVNEGEQTYGLSAQVAGEPVAVTLLKWEPISSDVLFIGWTANYARHREHRDNFLGGAVDLWDVTVARAAKKVLKSGV